MAFLTEETGRTITNTGLVTVDYTNKQFGTSSASFNGSSNYLSIDASDGLFSFGTTIDFTLEFWVRSSILQVTPSGQSRARGIMEFRNASNASIFRICTVGRTFAASFYGLIVGAPGATVVNPPSSTTGLNNIWTHIAVCRDVTSLRSYVNGTGLQTFSNVNIANVNKVVLGNADISGNTVFTYTTGLNEDNGGSSYYLGNIDEFRAIRGKALYTGASFTPPTQEFIYP